jgi:hypothetical protein
VHPLAVVLTVATGGMVAGIGGAVVAVPLVAVTNTVVSYLKAYAEDQSPPPDAEDDDGGASGHEDEGGRHDDGEPAAVADGEGPADPPPGPEKPPSDSVK